MLNQEHVIVLNGRAQALHTEQRSSLGDFVRECGATSVHLACEHGVCGTCNVLLEGECVRSCLTLAHSCEGNQVTTLEGLNDALAERLRAAFNAHHALQCGFCTPGMFMSAYELLSSGEPLNAQRVREHLSGNICRCTGYQGIVDAVLSVAHSTEASSGRA